MNPNTNKFEAISENEVGELLRSDGSPVPPDRPVFKVGQTLTLRGYRWRVQGMGDSTLTLEAVGPLSKSQRLRNRAKRRRRQRKK